LRGNGKKWQTFDQKILMSLVIDLVILREVEKTPSHDCFRINQRKFNETKYTEQCNNWQHRERPSTAARRTETGLRSLQMLWSSRRATVLSDRHWKPIAMVANKVCYVKGSEGVRNSNGNVARERWKKNADCTSGYDKQGENRNQIVHMKCYQEIKN